MTMWATERHRHQWSQWTIVTIDLVSPWPGVKDVQVTGQSRRCQTCGYTETARLEPLPPRQLFDNPD